MSNDVPSSSDTYYWKCPECGHEKPREYEKERPFCDECEFRDGVLIEMRLVWECPGCEDESTFSEGGKFGNLTCDSCEYMPRKKLRDTIRSLHAETEQ